MKIVQVYHADHGVSEETLEWAVEQIQPTGFFLRTVMLPVEKHEPLLNSLYGPASGDDPVPESDVHYKKRSPDRPESRMIRKPPRPTHLLTVIGMAKPEGVIIYTAYGGPAAEREPGDPTLESAEDRQAAKEFWAEHALASEEVVEEAEENPPWVDQILTKNFDAIEKRVGIDRMPMPHAVSLSPRSKVKRFAEFGCGHYGCVLPTADPGIVFKVTSDPTEAKFVTAFMSLDQNEWPPGIVRYYGVWQTSDAYRRRPVFVLLREEAQNVGGLWNLGQHMDREISRPVGRVINKLVWFKEWAALARDRIQNASDVRKMLAEVKRLEDWAEDKVDWDEISARAERYLTRPLIPSRMKGAQAAAYALRAARIVAEEMVNADVGYLIGETFVYFLEQGLLLADVHLQNVGMVAREGYSNEMWVITDPGHMVALEERWLDIKVPEL